MIFDALYSIFYGIRKVYLSDFSAEQIYYSALILIDRALIVDH